MINLVKLMCDDQCDQRPARRAEGDESGRIRYQKRRGAVRSIGGRYGPVLLNRAIQGVKSIEPVCVGLTV